MTKEEKSSFIFLAFILAMIGGGVFWIYLLDKAERAAPCVEWTYKNICRENPATLDESCAPEKVCVRRAK